MQIQRIQSTQQSFGSNRALRSLIDTPYSKEASAQLGKQLETLRGQAKVLGRKTNPNAKSALAAVNRQIAAITAQLDNWSLKIHNTVKHHY